MPKIFCGCLPEKGVFCWEAQQINNMIRRAEEVGNMTRDHRETEEMRDRLEEHLGAPCSWVEEGQSDD